MNKTAFFFSATEDLKLYSASEKNRNAMYAMYQACKAINRPDRYGSSIRTIMITAVLQDYASKFHRPYVRYTPDDKTVDAKVKVDLEQVLKSGFLETVAIYEDTIAQVLDQVRDQAPGFDFEGLKRDLHRAIQEEIGILD
ncbi:MAG: hypothetical protein H6573_34975 [Lewinellaceae bacterium]|nr:hypothetical protein [Lewinellaceae bacterium]